MQDRSCEEQALQPLMAGTRTQDPQRLRLVRHRGRPNSLAGKSRTTQLTAAENRNTFEAELHG